MVIPWLAIGTIATVASVVLSIAMGIPFIIALFKIFTNEKILFAMVIAIGLVAIIMAKRGSDY